MKMYLAIKKGENLSRGFMVLFIDRSDYGLHLPFHGLNPILQRTRPVLGITVQVRNANPGSNGGVLNKSQVLEALLLLLLSLHNPPIRLKSAIMKTPKNLI